MVELPGLLIGPWGWQQSQALPGWEGAGWGRLLADAATAAPLGFVRAGRLGIWPWLTPHELEICETEDASLLMTLQHPWLGFGRWHIVDAEKRRLGSVLLPHVLDADGLRLATVQNGAAHSRLFRRASGEVCATFETQSGGELLLRFTAEAPADPYGRMVVLGAALALAPRPGVAIGARGAQNLPS
jgi:hypothetical protein